MGLTELALRLLLPRGSAWALAGHGGALARGIARSLERLLAAIRSIESEANPGTATDTLPEWHTSLGQRFDPTLPLATQRARLEAFRYSAGGSMAALLAEQIALEYPGISVAEACASSECGEDECGVGVCGAVHEDQSPVYFDVTGDIDTEEDAMRIGAIIARFAPVHLVPTLLISVRSLTASSECGLDICGLGECGNDGN